MLQSCCLYDLLGIILSVVHQSSHQSDSCIVAQQEHARRSFQRPSLKPRAVFVHLLLGVNRVGVVEVVVEHIGVNVKQIAPRDAWEVKPIGIRHQSETALWIFLSERFNLVYHVLNSIFFACFWNENHHFFTVGQRLELVCGIPGRQINDVKTTLRQSISHCRREYDFVAISFMQENGFRSFESLCKQGCDNLRLLLNGSVQEEYIRGSLQVLIF